MNWKEETASMIRAEEAFVARYMAQFNRIQPGMSVYYFNNKRRVNEWAAVVSVVPTSPTSGYVTLGRGRMVSAEDIKIVHGLHSTETAQINLNGRVDEIVDAAKRAESDALEVFADFELNHYVVVNREHQSEYHVALVPAADGLNASCVCPDFSHRNRVCKHIVSVLRTWYAPMFDEAMIAAKPFSASVTYGNFKGMDFTKTDRFTTLEAAQEFIRRAVAGLEGGGEVVCDGLTVWSYSTDAELF